MIENDVAYKYTLIIFIKTAARYHGIGTSRAAKNEVTRLLFRPSKRASESKPASFLSRP